MRVDAVCAVQSVSPYKKSCANKEENEYIL